MTPSVALIFNPKAGQGDPDRKLSSIQQTLEPYCHLKTYLTTRTIEPSQLTKLALRGGVRSVIAAGGDGTISGVANALVRTGIPLGVIPTGTLNSFAAVLGIPANLEAACRIILSGVTRSIDIARCNGKILTLQVAIGYEADTIAATDRAMKRTWGVLAYLVSGIQQLRQLKRFRVSLASDRETIELNAASVTIANAAPAKNFLAQGPAGVICDDGLLDVTAIAPNHWTTALGTALHLFRSGLDRTRVEHQDVCCFRTRKIAIQTDPPQRVAIDGDLWGMTPVEIDCVPHGLTVYVPR
jgi:YegS/Rv2252/BmrU family lipid kinase